MDFIFRRLIVLIAMSLLFGIVISAKAAGFRTLEVNELVIGVWYPSDSPETAGRLGPFDVEFAFIAPFAKRVTDNEDIPVARDPLGFDRTKFISDLNEELIEFFHSR